MSMERNITVDTIKKKSENVSTIGGSDGSTTIFLAGGKQKTLKQKIQKTVFGFRKKWCALWLKPEAHTMDEVISYIKEKYNFTELSEETEESRLQQEDLKAAFIMLYEPELLGEYPGPPKINSMDEKGIRQFQEQWEILKQKARAVSDDVFPLDFHHLVKCENENNMHLYIESRFGYIGGGFGGKGKRGSSKFDKIYKDIHKYYGVTEDDIANNSKQYQTLIKTLTM